MFADSVILTIKENLTTVIITEKCYKYLKKRKE